MNQETEKSTEKEAVKKIAVIRISGRVGLKGEIKDTFNMLRLYRKNYCVILPATPDILGMINRVKDYITWGEIDDTTYKLLIQKRGQEFKGRETDTKRKIKYKTFITIGEKKYKPFFRLNPPRGGFERKGTKLPFHLGGALGYRAGKIADLIKRMI